jgi:hypothetical protein
MEEVTQAPRAHIGSYHPGCDRRDADADAVATDRETKRLTLVAVNDETVLRWRPIWSGVMPFLKTIMYESWITSPFDERGAKVPSLMGVAMMAGRRAKRTAKDRRMM